jgi:hypothetical protein
MIIPARGSRPPARDRRGRHVVNQAPVFSQDPFRFVRTRSTAPSICRPTHRSPTHQSGAVSGRTHQVRTRPPERPTPQRPSARARRHLPQHRRRIHGTVEPDQRRRPDQDCSDRRLADAGHLRSVERAFLPPSSRPVTATGSKSESSPAKRWLTSSAGNRPGLRYSRTPITRESVATRSSRSGIASSPWLTGLDAASAPDVVLLLAGTNDVTDTADPPTPSWRQMHSVISSAPSQMRCRPARSSSGRSPRTSCNERDNVAAYNAKLQDIIDARVDAGDNVRLVNTGEVIVVGDLVDVEHPGAFGYGKIADVWFQGARRLVPGACPSGPCPDRGRQFQSARWAARYRNDGPDVGDFRARVGIVGQEAATTNAIGERITILDVGRSDVSVSADVRLSPTNGTPSLSFRAVNTSQYLLAGISRREGVNQIGLFKRDGGDPTPLQLTVGTGLRTRQGLPTARPGIRRTRPGVAGRRDVDPAHAEHG